MGALDSACNRTCSGDVWVGHYMKHLEVAPDWIRHPIKFESEDELFRFGNGGSQRSSQRVRVPIMVGNSLVLVWISVVKVPSLGLLLGRDFLDAIGAVLSFSRKMLRADNLDGYLIPLKQLMAGHFALPLLPRRWPGTGRDPWRRFGQDGVIEVQASRLEWLKRKLNFKGGATPISNKPREHLVTEQGFRAADVSFLGLPAGCDPGGVLAPSAMPITANQDSAPLTTDHHSHVPKGQPRKPSTWRGNGQGWS